jgi:hypothetical protein
MLVDEQNLYNYVLEFIFINIAKPIITCDGASKVLNMQRYLRLIPQKGKPTISGGSPWFKLTKKSACYIAVE